jgi:hypothetical protein
VNPSRSRVSFFPTITGHSYVHCVHYIHYVLHAVSSNELRDESPSVITTTNCRASTHWMNVSYTVGHERASSILCQSIVSILCVLMIF